jgi:hypothetical protein
MSLPVPFPTDGDIQQKTQIGFRRQLWTPGSFDYTVWEDSFTGDAILDEYPAAKTNGASAAVTFAEHNVNKYLSLVSGTADDGYAGQGVGMQYTGDRGVLLQGIVRTPSAVTTLKIEFGLSDADDDAGAVNVKATPSATAADFAVFVVDTDDDTNIGFVSAKAGTLTATQDIQAVAASTTYRFAIRVEGDAVSGWLNGTQVAGGSHVIEGGNALTPWCFVQARAGSASRTVQLHKWQVIQPAY